jgi:integrase
MKPDFHPPHTPKRHSISAFQSLQSKKILNQFREQVRYLHYSVRTEESYLCWIRYFIRWVGLRHPREMGAAEVSGFLTFLAAERNVSVSTHRVALSAILFLYQKVLGIELSWLDDLARPTVPRRLPVVLTQDEVQRVLSLLAGTHAVLACLLYGTGMRITEALQLRVKDVDFDHRAIIIREGKGFKDRVVMLPQSLVDSLKHQLSDARGDQPVGPNVASAQDACRISGYGTGRIACPAFNLFHDAYNP